MLPSSDSRSGRPFGDGRRVFEGSVHRYRAGIPWRDVPAEFGPRQSIWKCHRRYAGDGTWDTILARLPANAERNHGGLAGDAPVRGDGRGVDVGRPVSRRSWAERWSSSRC